MTVAELGRRMSSAEFSEWGAFYDLEPFGPAREGTPPYKAADFFARETVAPEPVNLGDRIRAALRAAAPRERKVRQVPRD